MYSGGKIANASAEKLDRIFKQFETHLEGVTRAFCVQSEIDPESCYDLVNVLSAGESETIGVVTDNEVSVFVKMGFTAEDVRIRVGEGGAAALKNRVKWMADRLTDIWGRRPIADRAEQKANADEIRWIVSEVGLLGEHAAGTASSLRNIIESIEDPELKLAAINALMFSSDDAEGDASVLTALIGDGSKEVRMTAIDWLGRLNPQIAVRSLESLEKVFSDENEDDDVRLKAVSSFVKIAYPEPRALAEVFAFERDPLVQSAAFKELSQKDWGNARNEILSLLLIFLRRDDISLSPEFEKSIITLIAEKGGDSAVPTLFEASYRSREAVAEFVSMNPQETLPVLREYLKDSARQFQAAILISEMLPPDTEAVQTAAEVLMKKAESSEKIEESISALARLGEGGKTKLAILLDDDDRRVRTMAAMWLADAPKLPDTARNNARTILAEALEDEEMKFGAAIAIMKIGAPNDNARKKAIGILKSALTTHSPNIEIARRLLKIRGLASSELKRIARKVAAGQDQ